MEEENTEKLDSEEIQELIDGRIEQKKQEIKEEAKKELINELSNEQDPNKEKDHISRRDFLKKIGAGAAGAGALALLPSASAFNIRTSNPLQYFNSSTQSNPNFSVQTDGTVETSSVLADKIRANNELKLPDQTASENKKIWINEKTDASELKVKLKDQVKTITTVTTVSDSVIDHFEAKLYENIDKTLSDYYEAQSGSLSGVDRVQASPVFEGDYALRFSREGGRVIYAQDSPNRGFNQGNTARWQYQHDGNVGDIGALFAPHNNGGNFYAVVDRTLTDDLRIYRYDGSYNQIANSSVSTPADEELTAELSWATDGTITFKVFDSSDTELGSVSGQDSTYSDSDGNGWGWRFRSDTVNNESSVATVDHARVI